MKNFLKVILFTAMAAVSSLASAWIVGQSYYYATPDPYYPVYYSVDRYTGTHYVREPYYNRQPYYRVVRTYGPRRVVHTRPVVWVPSHTTRCCAVSGHWREAPYMSAGGRTWVPAYYGGRERGWVQGHWVIPD